MKVDITGRKFGMLTVLPLLRGTRHRRVLCRCVCGVLVEAWQTNLQSGGGKRGCGCLKRAAQLKRQRKDATARAVRQKMLERVANERAAAEAKREVSARERAWRGSLRSAYPREHSSWSGMVGRCTRPDNKDFPNYGGRGILVCDRWREDFEAFLSDLGPRPTDTTLDRKDNAGGYEPLNCRWSTYNEQNRNSRQCKLTILDVLAIVAALKDDDGPTARSGLAKLYGVTPTAIYMINRGRAWGDVTGITRR